MAGGPDVVVVMWPVFSLLRCGVAGLRADLARAWRRLVMWRFGPSDLRLPWRLLSDIELFDLATDKFWSSPSEIYTNWRTSSLNI